MSKNRIAYRIIQVRAKDLTDTDVALIGGRWCRVADVHGAPDGNWDDIRNSYGSEDVTALIGEHGEDGPVGQVLVRYLLTGKSTSGGIDDALILLDRVALVDIQIGFNFSY